LSAAKTRTDACPKSTPFATATAAPKTLGSNASDSNSTAGLPAATHRIEST
jgi:hypothetical protein